MKEEDFDLNQGDYDGRTALHLAAAEGHIELVRFLLEAQVNPGAVDRWGETALTDATQIGHVEIEALLRSVGATAGESIQPDRQGASDSLSSEPTDVDAVDVVALLWAAADNDRASIMRLVANGVSMTAADYDGRTALHLAAAEGHKEIVEYLVAHGADRTARDRWGATASDEARNNGYAEIAEVLAG